MIRLFRKIRQNLLSENNYSMYLLYASGEIILVVIGILVALGINNRNQRSIRNDQFKLTLDQVYTNLKCDLDVAIWDLERVKEQGIICDSLFNNQLELEDLQLLKTLHYLDWYPGSGFLVSNFDYYVGQLQYSPDETSKSSLVFHISAFYNLMHNGFTTDYNLAKDKFLSPLLTKHNIPVAGKVNLLNIIAVDSTQLPLISQDMLENLKTLTTKVEYYSALASTANRIQQLAGLIGFRIEEINSLMNMIQIFEPNVKFSFDQIEIIGSGLIHKEKDSGMMIYNDQYNTWNITTELRKGGIKFSSSYATYLTWGKDKVYNETIKFWGEEIPVEEGAYSISLDLTEMKYELVKE